MLSSDQDEPSIWAKNIKRFKEGNFKREGEFESSEIRDLVTIGHVEDVNKYLPQLPDGPYSISDAEMKDLNESRPVRQPAYRITAPVMGPRVAEGHVKIGDSEVPVREYLGEEWVKNRVKPLHSIQPAKIPSDFAIRPNPWQLTARRSTDRLWCSNYSLDTTFEFPTMLLAGIVLVPGRSDHSMIEEVSALFAASTLSIGLTDRASLFQMS